MRNSVRMLVLVGLATVGCDTVKQAQSTQIMIAEVLASPDESVAGHAIKGKVLASAFLGTRDRTNLQAAPTPTTGAKIHLEANGTSIDLAEKGGGVYEVSSIDQSTLTYVAGGTYRFVATLGGDTFAESVIAPERESIAEFHQGGLAPDAGGPQFYPDGGAGFGDGGLGFVMVQAGQNLTLTRPPADGERNIALTIVAPITDQGPQKPTFTDPPLDPQGLITILLDPSKYKQNTVTIDGSKAWATCPPSDYLLTVTAMKKGSSEGTNLFLGSTVLAGSADAAPARCQ
jgi:hypothetical protein